jgi:carboxymethylenebutenolidase
VAIASACLRVRPECSGRIGVLGFGLGGGLAHRAAAQIDLDAAVAYCPTNLDLLLRDHPAIACPIILHVADRMVPDCERSALQRALATHHGSHVYVYPDRGLDPLHPDFDEATSLMASSRTIAMFRQTIGPSCDRPAPWGSTPAWNPAPAMPRRRWARWSPNPVSIISRR